MTEDFTMNNKSALSNKKLILLKLNLKIKKIACKDNLGYTGELRSHLGQCGCLMG